MRRPALPVAFRERPFSLFFTGQVASNVGAWFQNLALSLVLLEVTGQAQALSAVTIAQFTPILLLSIPAGRLADRLSPRTILFATSAASALVVLALSFAIADVERNLVLIYGLIAVLGSINAFDRVAAQSIIHLLVDREVLGSAVATYTMALSVARSIGPGLAGIAFTSLGGAVCLQINAASYAIVLLTLVGVRLRARPPRSAAETLASGLRELRGNRWFVTLVLVNMLIAVLALNLMIVLTSFVSLTFGGDASAVGLVHALNAVGSIVGGLIASSRCSFGPRLLALSLLCMSVAFVGHVVAPDLLVVMLLAPLLGAAHGLYMGVLHAAAQSSVRPELIGRAMSLMSLSHYGVMPFGALLVGVVIDVSSAAVALAIAAGASLAAAVLVLLRSRR